MESRTRRADPKGAPPDGDATTLQDLDLLVRSRFGLIHVESRDEDRVATILAHLADRLALPLFTWTRSKGLRRADKSGAVYATEKLAAALSHIESSRFPAIYHLRGFGEEFSDAAIVAVLRDTARTFEHVHGGLVLTGPGLTLPESLASICATFRLPQPSAAEYKRLIGQIVRDVSKSMQVEATMPAADLARLVGHLSGFTLFEASKILTKAIIEDGKLDADDIDGVIAAKKEIVEREGVLEYFPAETGLADIADLAALKEWLRQRRQIIIDPERAAGFGLSFPRGILLLGVPGCGKSLCAKAVAREWALPLLKLDPSNLYNKYVGESERNFKRAMQVASRLAPVVLWIDELEKAFASGGGEDGGVSRRVFGSFLSWMQERQEPVFVVATANDVAQLPPEFLRKGRFDEIFFVDLPTPEARQAIFRIHLKKRHQDPAGFDLAQLVEHTEGFSGAEIEQVIVAAAFNAFAAKSSITTDTLLNEIQATRPLAATMEERISALRTWAADRVRSAH